MLEAGGGSWPAHLEAHVVGEAGEEVVLHMAADERVAEGPVEQGVAGQVEHAQAHQVDALGLPIGREHGEADVLQEKGGSGSRSIPPGNVAALATPSRGLAPDPSAGSVPGVAPSCALLSKSKNHAWSHRGAPQGGAPPNTNP